LAHGTPEAPTPDEAQVAELTRWINKFIERPWNAEDINEYRARQKTAQAQRKTLLAAAQILRQRLDKFREEPIGPPPFPNAPAHRLARVRDYETTIAELERPWSFHDEMLPEMPLTGRRPTPWAVMARKLAIETLDAIQAAQTAASVKPHTTFGAENGPIVHFIRAMLMRILKTTNAPACSTILESISLLRQRDRVL
jgi:hypothetical protein